MQRLFLWAGVACAMALVIAIAIFAQAPPVSTYSSFDTRVNGYQALFNVLRSEGVPVMRLQQPLALRPAGVRVMVFTSTAPERSVGQALVYDANDYKRLAQFEKGGGRLVFFSSPQDERLRRDFAKYHVHPVILDATRFTNAALSSHPEAMTAAYDALAGHGLIAFDERLHGYAVDQKLWSVLPAAVRFAFWLVIAAIVIALIEANVRLAPAMVAEPPAERDSSAYISSMASLLRRATARRAALARFAKSAPRNAEVQDLARLDRPSDAVVVRAAQLVALSRKEKV